MVKGKPFSIGGEKLLKLWAFVVVTIPSTLFIGDVICFKNYVLPLKANFQRIKCKASFCHYFTVGNELKTISCVKTIEVANEMIRE